MPQYPGLYPTFSVEEFLWYMAALKGMTKERAVAAIPAVLEAVELSDVALSLISDCNLSGHAAPRTPTLEDYYLYIFGGTTEKE